MEENKTMEKNKLSKGEEDIQKLTQRLSKNASDIHISRIPKPTKKTFIDLANEDFAGDYGMCLKWLIDDLISADSRVFLNEINMLKERVNFLEESLSTAMNVDTEETKKDKVRKMLNGKEKQVAK